MSEQQEKAYFNGESLKKLIAAEGKHLKGVICILWQNSINKNDVVELIDHVQFVFTDGYKLTLGSNQDNNGLEVVKVLQSGFYWPTLFREARKFVLSCDECQRIGNISKRQEMPMNCSLVIEPFDVWGFDYMGPFPKSNGYTHILVAVDYVLSG